MWIVVRVIIGYLLLKIWAKVKNFLRLTEPILGIRLKPPYIHEIFTKMQYGKKTDVFQIRSLRITTRPRLQNGVAKNLLWNSENHIWTTIIRTPKHVSFDCFTKKSSLNLKSPSHNIITKNIYRFITIGIQGKGQARWQKKDLWRYLTVVFPACSRSVRDMLRRR